MKQQKDKIREEESAITRSILVIEMVWNCQDSNLRRWTYVFECMEPTVFPFYDVLLKDRDTMFGCRLYIK